MSIRLLHGDCREVLKTLADNSVDSIVTDPPYGLTQGKKGGSGPASVNLSTPQGRARVTTGFMGMTWDADVPPVEVWAECIRVLKPGGVLLAFFGTRTYHRGATRIEDAGFEIRDQVAWGYGSGFPKSHNGPWGGTALKPAWEPICMARKPLEGTVEANWRKWGTGALNIDGCRVEYATVADGDLALNPQLRTHINGGNGGHIIATEDQRRVVTPHELGRWPANLIHDGSEEVLAVFPAAPGAQSPVTGAEPSASTKNTHGTFKRAPSDRTGEASADRRYTDAGGTNFAMLPGQRRKPEESAARFFYCAKADRADRNEGGVNNTHPTVKPTDLMRYLCRLVTPPGGTVLDPFAGSGSTLKAAELEGFSAIGIELSAEYIEIARRRIAGDAPLFAEVSAA